MDLAQAAVAADVLPLETFVAAVAAALAVMLTALFQVPQQPTLILSAPVAAAPDLLGPLVSLVVLEAMVPVPWSRNISKTFLLKFKTYLCPISFVGQSINEHHTSR